MQIHIIKHNVIGILCIAEGNIFEVNAAIWHFVEYAAYFLTIFICKYYRRRIFYFGNFIKHFNNSRYACPGKNKHDEHHGKHHERHENLCNVGDEADKLTGLHLANDNHLAAKPEHNDNARVHNKLHERHVQNNYFFCLELCRTDFVSSISKFFVFKFSTDKTFHHAYRSHVFLHRVVQFVILFEHHSKPRICCIRNKPQTYCKHWNNNEEHGRKLPVQKARHDSTAYEHERSAHTHAHNHLVCVLRIGHVSGKTRNKRSC